MVWSGKDDTKYIPLSTLCSNSLEWYRKEFAPLETANSFLKECHPKSKERKGEYPHHSIPFHVLNYARPTIWKREVSDSHAELQFIKILGQKQELSENLTIPPLNSLSFG